MCQPSEHIKGTSSDSVLYPIPAHLVPHTVPYSTVLYELQETIFIVIYMTEMFFWHLQ